MTPVRPHHPWPHGRHCGQCLRWYYKSACPLGHGPLLEHFCECESCFPVYQPTRVTLTAARVDAVLREMGMSIWDDDGARLGLPPSWGGGGFGLRIYVCEGWP